MTSYIQNSHETTYGILTLDARGNERDYSGAWQNREDVEWVRNTRQANSDSNGTGESHYVVEHVVTSTYTIVAGPEEVTLPE